MEETGTFEEISELPQEAPQAFAEAVVDVAAG
jgi:hypothetical protein